MARFAICCCLLALLFICNTEAQQCGNSGGACPEITEVSQCTADIFSKCCSRCNDLASCFNTASDCYINYSVDQCYEDAVVQQCCTTCAARAKPYLSSSCLFGDKQNGCVKANCGSSDSYNVQCCETCYVGTTPFVANVTIQVSSTSTIRPARTENLNSSAENNSVVTVTIAQQSLDTTPTTTQQMSSPSATVATRTDSIDEDECKDTLQSCPSAVAAVPSSCYNSDTKDRCCQSCKNLTQSRGSLGYNVTSCPYGDRAAYCVEDAFDENQCGSNDNSYFCCDTCNPLATPCEDTGLITCDLSPSFCYTTAESSFYATECCGTCAGHVIVDLDYSCRYGDREASCDEVIDTSKECTQVENEGCCETCYNAGRVTTMEPCTDSHAGCSVLVDGTASNCYELENDCCATCRPFRQNYRPGSCRYGDKSTLCNEDRCDILGDQCCATCDDTTTMPITTTRAPCSDTENDCMDGLYNLRANPFRCYRQDIRDICCNSCRTLETGVYNCSYGNRDSICDDLSDIDCSDEELSSICCGECGDVTGPPPQTTTMTPMSTTMPVPSNCTDTLATCDDLVEASLYKCYPLEYLEDKCCASCYRSRKTDLPWSCQYGDRIQSCGVFITQALCDSDEGVRGDCCETCHQYVTSTVPPQPTICPNEWSDATCVSLFAQLNGDCSTISEKCCRTCYSTTTSTTTTMAPTTDACQNVFPGTACQTIISAEGEDECATSYMQENCCASCRAVVTTPPPVCTGDSLPNCADVQALTLNEDICNVTSSFRELCCEFCGDNQSPSTPMRTTTLPPGCNGDVWSQAVCAATIETSPLEEPCESDLISENCCAYCAMLTRAMSTITTMMTTTGPHCPGDDASINCASLDMIVDVCGDMALSVACCDYCSPDPSTTTTTSQTTSSAAPTGFCAVNVYSLENCQVLVDSQGPLVCATDLMITNCCPFCTSLTFPTTTTQPTSPTTPACLADNMDLNCTQLDDQFGGNLCTPLVNADLREQCCFYCNNRPVTMTTPEPTTTVCVDILDSVSCIALYNTGTCSNDFGQQQCCATCSPTTPYVTTTRTPCNDTGALDCQALADDGGIDPCNAHEAVVEACCGFCFNRTTLAPPVTAGPCFGNSFVSPEPCQNRNTSDPDFCTTDSTWINLCCEFCGYPVITESTSASTVVAASSDPTASGATTVPAPVCEGNRFNIVLCETGLRDSPETCDDPSWYNQCCEYCDNHPDRARRRRSIDEDSYRGNLINLNRVRRQVDDGCITKNETVCEAVFHNSETNPKFLICATDLMRVDCCDYCVRASNDGAIPDGKGCWNDTWSYSLCQTVINGDDGIAECETEFMQEQCCLSCALAALRTTEATSTTIPVTTTAATTTTTLPASIDPVPCNQEWGNATCLSIIANGVACDNPVIIDKCCDFACVTTTTPIEETTTEITSTTTSTSTTTIVTTTAYTDPVPDCTITDKALTCSSFANQVPSLCYDDNMYQECCQTCTDLFYDRKANGHNVEKCAYGNRDANCTTVDCENDADAMRCCDVCYPRVNMTARPVVGSLISEYAIIVAIDGYDCLTQYADRESVFYTLISEFVISGLKPMFSILPGTQVYSTQSIRCNASISGEPLIVHTVMETPPTHTFNELLALFDDEISDGRVGIYEIDRDLSSFHFAELYDGECGGNEASNCELANSPGSKCYDSEAFEKCCVSCNDVSRALYADRKYIPVGCEHGDKEIECGSNISCSMPVAQKECCYSCAVEPEDYIISPSTTPTQNTTVDIVTASTTAVPTTTPKICLGDTGNRCHNLTKQIRSCYIDELIYDLCCETCNNATLWYLPAECAWGDKESWCSGILDEQCSIASINEACCDRCGPHLTTTSTTTTTSIPTTTPVCKDLIPNCANLTLKASNCYKWSNDCCASCAPKVIDYLPYTCRFGDQEDYCLSIQPGDCVDPFYAADCCKVCGPPEPTTTTTITSTTTTTTEPTTAPTTTTMLPTTTSDPGCVADANMTCNFLTQHGGCYNMQVEADCCLSCEANYEPDAPDNCRYGDYREYCTSVTRQRCLTEARVFTDCCSTCQGLVAPPGVCIDRASNCDVLTSDASACYEDFIYDQCCDMCEDKVLEYLDPTCKWGDYQTFCDNYDKEDCEGTAEIQAQCCELCTDIVTTTVMPTTTTQQCIDSSNANCVEDTSQERFCYDDGVRTDCCATCGFLADRNNPSCLYGDKEDWCQFFERENCDSTYIIETCCELCAVPTTTQPTTSVCYDASNCTGPASACYSDSYRAVCCATCKAEYDLDALYGCEYGDKDAYCQFVTKDKCIEFEAVRDDCCETCPILTATTTSAETTTTTSRTTTTTPPTTQPPQCLDAEVLQCSVVTAEGCYSDNIRESCCLTCSSYETDNAMCPYGDQDVEFCSSDVADCSLSVVKSVCCDTCSDYVVLSDVEANYQLKINITSLRCTVGLNDRSTAEYATFKYDIEKAVENILMNLPGIQISELTDISCGSVIAILKITSVGFYNLVELNTEIMVALSSGSLQGLQTTYIVSVTGSSLRAISFEAPSCVDTDLSMDCLENFVLVEPSQCYFSPVRSQCCQSCSSLFYSRLAAGVDMDSCPYGDRDVECFTQPNIDCHNDEARSRCCDRCASVSTTPPPTTTTTEPASTTTTTVPCVDDDPSLCTQITQNSLTSCYTQEAMCCATCKDLRIAGAPEDCAWGDKSDSCAGYDRALCASNPSVNATCCQLCSADVEPTEPPCAGDADNVNYDCSLIEMTPSLCYDTDYYSHCCQSCLNVRMDYLPPGCYYGDKSDFCDSTAAVCSQFGDDLCCASCCENCQSPSPSPTTSISTSSTPTLTTQYTPEDCVDDSASCSAIVLDASSCYDPQTSSSCCLSCYNIRRTNLPESCAYGDKISSCSVAKWENCTDPSSMVSDVCCGTCYDLLDLSCNETAEQVVSNCDQTMAQIGSCYSKEALEKCCTSCKSLYQYTLPEDCRFGDKVNWCSDIDANNIDRICGNLDYQQQCCQTCKGYIDRTTMMPPTTAAVTSTTTTMTTTTRLPPNEQCPQGDTAVDCADKTEATGSCYDPAVSDVCCRTCYELWREDLPNTCRYGDKSTFCTTTAEDQIDYNWCVQYGETCCSRCYFYLTTTVPPTTLPDECPDGNLVDNCHTLAEYSYQCYSPVREGSCCVQCNGFIKPYLPTSCKYGDKSDFCRDLTLEECDIHEETCCETCGSTTTPTSTTTTSATTASTTTTSTTPMTTILATTERAINRPSAMVGRNLFVRPVPPGTIALFSVSFSLGEVCQQVDADLKDPNSIQFKRKEEELCLDISQKMWSVTNCYLGSIDCTQDADIFYTTYILVDSAMNYDNVDFNANQLKTELLAGQSRRKRAVSYDYVLVSDVNECNSDASYLTNGCADVAQCTNTQGMYTCKCPEDMQGDGFHCQFRIYPHIGRSDFSRSVPPGLEYLFQLELTINYTANDPHTCFTEMNDPTSAEYGDKESVICRALGDTMLSLSACYVHDFFCDNLIFRVTAHVIIDGSINYPDSTVSASMIKNELAGYNGQITSDLVQDIDECSTQYSWLEDGCHESAACINSPGLYTCDCNVGYTGDGFSCTPASAVTQGSRIVYMEDWTIAVIVVGAVIFLVAVVLALICCCRYGRKKPKGHEQLTGGEDTPPQAQSYGLSHPPLYNSMRSAYAPSEYAESYFYAQQERELPGYAHKTYNVASNVPETDDTTMFHFS